MLNIADCIDRGDLPASVAVVIATRAEAAAVHRARDRGFDVRVAPRKNFANDDEMHEAITSLLLEHLVDLVCLGGYMRWYRVDPSFEHRAMNIHPALLPDFGGKGMYGPRVHRAVLDSDATVSGCTVHFVDDQYDHGPIILQEEVAVHANDTAESLAERVQEIERRLVPKAIQLFAKGQLTLKDQKAQILPPF